MKLCTCRHCDHVFTTAKVQAFCSGRCRQSYTLINPKPTNPTANLDGAITNDNSNTQHSNR
jgi:hypothetical protein